MRRVWNGSWEALGRGVEGRHGPHRQVRVELTSGSRSHLLCGGTLGWGGSDPLLHTAPPECTGEGPGEEASGAGRSPGLPWPGLHLTTGDRHTLTETRSPLTG